MKTFLMCAGAAAALITGTALAQTAPVTATANKTISRSDIQSKVRKHFARIDLNRDGAVTTAEIGTARAQRKAHATAKRPDAAFDRIDVSNDGTISRDEFAKHRAMRADKRAAKTADGGAKGIRGNHHRMGMMAMRMADSNKDGRITLAEAEAAALQRFDMADANRDGQLTRDERQQMHERMRAEHAQKRG